MPQWPRAIIFDFDGVIVNSEPLHFWAFHDTLRAEKIGLAEDEYYREYIGFDDKGAFKRIFAAHGRELDPKTFLRVMTRKKETMMQQIESRKYQALPGVEEFVRGVWRFHALAICSGALRDEIEAMLEGVSLRDCFSEIVSAEDVTNGKPDPEGYHLTAARLSARLRSPLRPADCLVIEDAPKVIDAVRAEGFMTLALATTYPPEKLQGAHYITRSLRPEEVQSKIPGLRILR